MKQFNIDPSIVIPFGECHCGCGDKTRIYTENHPGRGIIKGQPVKYISGHNPSGSNRAIGWETRKNKNHRLCTCGGWKTRGRPMCRECWEKDGKPPIDSNTYLIYGQLRRRIPLTQGLYAWVYASDFDKLNQFNYYAHFTPQKGSHYAKRTLFKDGRWTATSMHNDVLEVPEGKTPDHIHPMDTLNNCRDNLRPASSSQNASNHMPKKGLGNRNIRKIGKHWEVRICANGVIHRFYPISTLREACEVREDKVKELHGEFATLRDNYAMRNGIKPSFEWLQNILDKVTVIATNQSAG